MINKFTSVKLISGGGMSYTKLIDDQQGAEVNQKEITVKDTGVPHPHLVDAFADLGNYFLRLIGLDVVPGILALPKDEDATAKMKTAVKTLTENLGRIQVNIQDNLEVTGVSISGTDDKPKVVLSGKYKTPSGQCVALNTALTSLTGTTYGFEAKLLEAIEGLTEEVENYDGGKRSQLSMEFGQETAEEIEKKMKVA